MSNNDYGVNEQADDGRRITWDGFEPPAARLVTDHLDRLADEIVACSPGAYRLAWVRTEFGGNRVTWANPFHMVYGPKQLETAFGSAWIGRQVTIGMPDGSLRCYQVTVSIKAIPPVEPTPVNGQPQNGETPDER